MSEAIEKHVKLLGFRAKDKVTGFDGVITNLSLDLYGCVQYLINPGMDKDLKLMDQAYFDVTRVEIISEEPVMEQPDFDYGYVAEGKKGSCMNKPVSKS